MEIPGTLCSNVYDFAFCPEPCYDRLVDLADPEDWGPGNRILKNYLSFSFSRAVFLTERDVDQTAPSNLPLCLTGDKPELALTIQREDGFYAARTCLTLDMAYNNARLICRPETSWIKR